MTTSSADRGAAPRLIRTAQLNAEGLSWRGIRDAVRSGSLLTLRTGSFAPADTPAACVAAGRLVGRLCCVSELRRRGVFVLQHASLHIHVDPHASRLPVASSEYRVHRQTLRRSPHPSSLSVEVFDALIDAVQCQVPRAAIATLDSALHHRLLRVEDLDELFAALPRRYRRLRPLLDGRAESGPESLLRLMLRALGIPFEVQVQIDGVGRVDFLVAGWLIIECDSKQFHSSWEDQLRDHRRDMAAAALGYITMRIGAEDIMWNAEMVQRALRGVIAPSRRVAYTG